MAFQFSALHHFVTLLLGLFILVVASAPALGQSITTNPYIKNIVENVLPRKYPLLVKYARKHPEFPVSWKAQSGEIVTATVRFEDECLSIEGTIYISSKPVIFMGWDCNLDSVIDLVTYFGKEVPSGHYSKRDPRDDAALIYWYTSLYAIVRFSKCCSSSQSAR